MAVYFQLYTIGSGEPVVLNRLDETLCTFLGVDVHPTRYVEDWFDVIGFRLAMGDSFEEILEYLEERKAEKPDWYLRLVWVCEWLICRYEPNAWYGR